MQDFQSLRPSEFRRLSPAQQRHYLRTVAEHLAEMTRLHADLAQPRAVGLDRSPSDDLS